MGILEGRDLEGRDLEGRDLIKGRAKTPFQPQPFVENHDRSVMSRRNLLICFDAFGTLFKPKRSIEKQYGEVARSLGLGGFSDDELKSSFRAGE